MNLTNQLGELTELLCRLDFCKRGITLSQPTNPSSRYDFIAEIDKKLIRIQCKTAHLETPSIISISVSSKNWNNGERHSYIGDIDYFYTNWENQGYLIPIDLCNENSRKKNIRLGSRSDYQNHNGAIYGQDYLIDLVLKKEAPDYNYEIVSIEHTSRTEAIIPTANFKYFCIDCGKPIRQKSTRCKECHYKFVHPVDIP